MTVSGVDYAWYRPSSEADLDGYTFVVRYLSNDASKNLTRAEAETLTGWGKMIVCNWESTGQGGSEAQGVADAQTAKQQADAAGRPAGRPIYFSIDENVDPTTQDGYLAGVLSVLPKAEVGVYGSAAMCAHWGSQGVLWEWRTMSTDWDGGSSTAGDELVQTGYAINGNADADYADVTDYGGWNLNTTAAPAAVAPTITVFTPQEDEMSQQSINGVAALGWAQGSKHVIQLGYDGTAPKVRAVLQLTTGPLVVTPEDGVVLGNGTYVYEIPADVVANARGVIVEDRGNTGTPFALYAA